MCLGMWSCDKAEVQAQLADRLASIILRCSTELALTYMEGFWDIMTLEWSGIDRLRLNKFYMLLKVMLKYGVKLMLLQTDSSSSMVTRYFSILKKYPMSLMDDKRPDAVRFFIAENFHEICKAEASFVSRRRSMRIQKSLFFFRFSL